MGGIFLGAPASRRLAVFNKQFPLAAETAALPGSANRFRGKIPRYFYIFDAVVFF